MTNQPEERTRRQFIVRWIVATLTGGVTGYVLFDVLKRAKTNHVSELTD